MTQTMTEMMTPTTTTSLDPPPSPGSSRPTPALGAVTNQRSKGVHLKGKTDENIFTNEKCVLDEEVLHLTKMHEKKGRKLASLGS